ncbi:MAG TPA: prepilin peptidase [Candidatus Angelobacter sp.]|nr:prepilin peptidase [Candidatus Angelobacter sp.]
MFGLVFGSFLNVCIYRMPREISVVSPRSACPGCEAPIAAYDNIPVLSWLILRGKCRKCKTSISPRYAAVELLTGILFALAWLNAPRATTWILLHCNVPDGINPFFVAVKFCVLSFLLIGLVFTDAETKLLPDLLTKPGIVLGLAFSLLVPMCDFPVPGVENWRVLSLISAAAGAVLGWAIILGIALLYEAIRGMEGMGRGDVKLMAMIGAFLGVKLALLVLLLASVVGSFFGVFLIGWVWVKRMSRRRRRHSAEPFGASRSRAWRSAILIYRNFEIPFGVFLGTAALFSAFLGMELVRWYIHVSGLGSLH